LKPLLCFPDLVELGLVANWTTLNNWISKRGFPPGHMVGRRRMWTAREVLAWIESQPTENRTPLKGIAKKAKAEADARRGVAR
jgi:predicted DNA-binding transcriptional regulator AlpA